MRDDLVKRARMAGHDERLADGQLYLDLADRMGELEAQLKMLRGALNEITECGGKTLLGGTLEILVRDYPRREPTTEFAHELGAARAFADCANMAKKALAATEPKP